MDQPELDQSTTLQTEAEKHNGSQWINRMPVELLSRIFLAGDKMDELDAIKDSSESLEDTEDMEGPRLEFQEIVVQVCRHWRAVAISMPMLWTYIRLDELYQCPRVALFLARSGDTIPLELELDMTGDFMAELEIYDSHAQAERATETLTFIVGNGGATSRWASLKVWGELPSVLLAVIDFIAGANLDNLHTLGLIHDYKEPFIIENLISKALLGRDVSRSVMFHKPPPLLRNVELDGIADEFLFANPSAPLLSNLVHLELSTTPHLSPLEGLYELLVQNPSLESLVLDMGLVRDLYFDQRFPRDKQVKLQHLRRFTIKDPLSTAWALEVLTRIDAPGVEAFTLDLDNVTMFSSTPADMPRTIAIYIAAGRKGGRLMTRPPTTESDDLGPIYPALRHITIGPFPGESSDVIRMLRRFNTITRLDWELGEEDGGAFPKLAKLPLPCPQLEYLRVCGVSDDELLQVVRGRQELGKPLKTVEINSSDWNSIKDSTKEYLKGALEKFGRYEGEYESDTETETEEDGWTDSDSEPDVELVISDESSDGEGWTDTDDDDGSDVTSSDSESEESEESD